MEKFFKSGTEDVKFFGMKEAAIHKNTHIEMEDNSAYTIGRVISKRMLPVVILYFLYGVWKSLDTILVANFVDSTAMTIVVMCSPLTFFSGFVRYVWLWLDLSVYAKSGQE